jgi:type II secretory pathway pseudopilin PulG
VIIGILVAVAIPVFNNVQRNAADRAHEANLRTLLGAGQMAVASGGVPGSQVVWTGLSTGENNSGQHLASLYLGTWPTLPAGRSLDLGAIGYQVTISVAGAVYSGTR